ncbi:uncharacterized protein V1510DRAFT_412954 [Dipodascopsis tothii]|uniref:uncharacterized protein n=1 Tax=Dipodascopsis tothii TaxID=44089 RepID=UPI0034CFD188
MLSDHNSSLVYASSLVFASVAVYLFAPSFLTDRAEPARAGSRYVVGLHNRANDCFANSDLQALAASQVLRAYLDSEATAEQPLTVALRRMIQDLNRPIRRPTSVSPWTFLRVLESVYKARITRHQQDAHELLHLILETLADEHEKARKAAASPDAAEKPVEKAAPPRPPLPFEGRTVDRVRCERCGSVSVGRGTTFVVLTLQLPQRWSADLADVAAAYTAPETITGFGCQSCRLAALGATLLAKVRRTEPGYEPPPAAAVAVDAVPDVADPAALLAYVRGVDRNADLPAEVEALLPKNVTATIERTTSFEHLPELLCLHLSRSVFSGTASRNSCRVTFPEQLTMRTESGGRLARLVLDGDPGEAEYRLVALVRHSGTHSAGHYECFRRKEMFEPEPAPESSASSASSEPRDERPPDRAAFRAFTGGKDWWRVSDDRVWEAKTDEVLKQKQSVYMLLYERIPARIGKL